MDELAVLAHSWTASLPSWLLLALALGAAWRITRGGGGSAVSELQAANEVLTGTLQKTRDDMGAEIRDLRVENAALRARTDVTIAIGPLLEWTVSHERRAQERHELAVTAAMENTARIVNVLELVAARLGPDPNGDVVHG